MPPCWFETRRSRRRRHRPRLEYNGGVERANLGEENLEALAKGLPNLLKHISNLKNVFGLPVVVAINRFVSDSDAELAMMKKPAPNTASKFP